MAPTGSSRCGWRRGAWGDCSTTLVRPAAHKERCVNGPFTRREQNRLRKKPFRILQSTWLASLQNSRLAALVVKWYHPQKSPQSWRALITECV